MCWVLFYKKQTIIMSSFVLEEIIVYPKFKCGANDQIKVEVCMDYYVKQRNTRFSLPWETGKGTCE